MVIGGVDVATLLLAAVGGTPVQSRVYGNQEVHTFAVPEFDFPVVVGGPSQSTDKSTDDGDDASSWIGADVGRFPITDDAFDAMVEARERVPSLATLRGASRARTTRLWTRHPFRADELSLAGLRASALAARSEARSAKGLLTRTRASDPELRLQVNLGVMEGLWRRDLARGGHGPGSFPTRAFLQDPLDDRWEWTRHADARVVCAWRLEASPWPVPLAEYSVTEAQSWIEARYPPDCVHLDILEGRVLATGALGVAAFVIEDRYDAMAGVERLLVEGGPPTLLDVASEALVLMRKLGRVVTDAMPRAEFGWLRPFTFAASTLTGFACVSVWNPETERLEVDDDLSISLAALALDPSSRERRAALLNLAETRFSQVQRRRH